MALDLRKHLFTFANPDTYVPMEYFRDDTLPILITVAQLKEFAPKLSDSAAKSIVDSINKLDILSTKLQVAHFLAQTAHESNYFTLTVENLNYSTNGLLVTFKKYFTAATAPQYARNPTKIGNKVYANRMGNGSEASGDGYKFRGRGYLQLTGKNNYTAFSRFKYKDTRLVTNPDSVASVEDAIDSSLWYWSVNNLNKYASKDDILSVSRIINLGSAEKTAIPNGYSDRQGKLTKIKTILGI